MYNENSHDRDLELDILRLCGFQPYLPDINLGQDLIPLSSSVSSNDEYFSCNKNELKPEVFKSKPVKHWDSTDVLQWLNSEAKAMKVFCTEINGTNFNKLDGFRLLEMTEEEFEKCDDKFGKRLFKQFSKLLSEQKFCPLVQGNQLTYTILDPVKKPMVSENDTNSTICEEICKDENEVSNNITTNQDGEKKKRPGPGRPKLPRKKKKQEKKLGRLWEFIRDLLKDEKYCPSLICWDNHDEGLFRFVQSEKVAQLWGVKKGNMSMNYEKLSRAMRYYYKSQVLQPVIGRRLVYKFGPNAKYWRVDNPNFKN